MTNVELINKIPRYSSTLSTRLAENIYGSCSNPEHELIYINATNIDVTDIIPRVEVYIDNIMTIRAIDVRVEVTAMVVEHLMAIITAVDTSDDVNDEFLLEECCSMGRYLDFDMRSLGYEYNKDYTLEYNDLDLATHTLGLARDLNSLVSSDISDITDMQVLGWSPVRVNGYLTTILMVGEMGYDAGDEYE